MSPEILAGTRGRIGRRTAALKHPLVSPCSGPDPSLGSVTHPPFRWMTATSEGADQ